MPMKQYKLVIFDFDGTLFATHEAIIHCIIKTFEKYNKQAPSRDSIYETITKGIGLEDTFRHLNPTLDQKFSDTKDEKHVNETTQWISTYREFYKNEGEKITQPFDNAKDVLEHLHLAEIAVVIISNKGIEAISSALDKFGLKSFISLVIGDTKGMKKKPDPMVFNEIIKPKFKEILSSEILMIGDTLADLLFAKNIGSDSCWATYGYGVHNECQSATPTYQANSLLDITSIIKKLRSLSTIKIN